MSTHGEGPGLLPVAQPIVERVPDFKRQIAVLSDRRVLLAPGANRILEVRSAVQELQRRGWADPLRGLQERPPEFIEALYTGAAGAPNLPVQVPAAPVNRSRAQDLAASVIRRAAAARASDIRIRVLDSRCEIMALVLGQLVSLEQGADAEVGGSLMHALFFRQERGTGETGYVPSEPQGFSVRSSPELPLPPSVSGLRIQRGPEKDGEVAMIRLLYDDGEIRPDLEGLGFLPEQCELFADARAERNGLVVLAGDKGEGKSTTLAHNLVLAWHERDGRDHIVTFEDPPELTIQGAIQVPVASGYESDDQREAGFSKWRNHFVRFAPHIGMIQEVRDRATARAVIDFVQTGTPVWTTLHVDDLHAIPLRLIDLGAEPHDVCYPGRLALICHQKLMPILCSGCAEGWEASKDRVRPGLRKRIEAWPGEARAGIRLRNAAGCGRCLRPDVDDILRRAQAGYSKRRIVAEMIRPDAAYLEHIQSRDPLGASTHWRKAHGGVPLAERAAQLVAAGELDPSDAEAKHFRLEVPPVPAAAP